MTTPELNHSLFLDPTVSNQLCVALLHSVWQVTLLAVLAGVCERLVSRRSARRAYVIHVLALFSGLVALPLTFALVSDSRWPAAALRPWAATDVASLASRDVPSSLPATAVEANRGVFASAAPSAPGSSASNAPAIREARLSWPAIAPWCVTLYFAGVTIMFARLVAAMFHAHRLAVAAQPIEAGALTHALYALAQRWSIRVVPMLARTEGILVPQIVGLTRPTILLPASALAGLTPEQLQMIVAHELAHVRRYDMWVNVLQRLGETILFFNPALWYLSRRISTLREYCCDELACEAVSASDGAATSRYAAALVRVAELGRQRAGTWGRGVARDRGDLAALAASGRSPSELRRRVARLFGEPLRESLRISRSGILAAALLTFSLIAGPTVWQAAAERDTHSTNQPADSTEANEQNHAASSKEATTAADMRVEMTIVIAQHVMLLHGQEIITWDELDVKIRTLPDPSRAYPQFYITRGAREAGLDQQAKDRIWELHRKYRLQGHSEGSLWPRTDLRFDRVKEPADLAPDEELRLEGTVVNQGGEPVRDAEVLLIAPVDQAISYRTYHVALVRGRVRNRLEHVMTDSSKNGRFTLYPPHNQNWYIVAMHPEHGFGLVQNSGFSDGDVVRLMPWAGQVSEVDEEPGQQQTTSLRTRIADHDGFPEVVFNQYWSDLKDDQPTRVFGFTHVPPIYETTISRDFHQADGGSTGVSAASLSLLPGETRRLGLGSLTNEQRGLLESMQTDFRSRRERAPTSPESNSPATSATDESDQAKTK